MTGYGDGSLRHYLCFRVGEEASLSADREDGLAGVRNLREGGDGCLGEWEYQ